MSRDITLFSGYDQKENRTTNYAILLLKMLYEDNPSFLDEALAEITDGQTEGRIGVQFQQQQRHGDSVPDAVITQEAVSLFVETKNTDWFYDDQLIRHLDSLAERPGLKVLLALSRFENLTDDRFDEIQRICRERYEEEVTFAPVGFEDFVRALRRRALPKRLVDAIGEFEKYLDEQNLLPKWKGRLDVCNCSKTLATQEEHGYYYCPATGGAYSHRRSRFFGAYNGKRVRYVAEIRAVVDVGTGPDDEASIYYSNTNEPEADLVAEAYKLSEETHSGRSWPMRAFLLGPLHETDFKKDSKGGMMGSKQYFDVSYLDPEDAEDLAEKLDGMTWAEAFAAP